MALLPDVLLALVFSVKEKERKKRRNKDKQANECTSHPALCGVYLLLNGLLSWNADASVLGSLNVNQIRNAIQFLLLFYGGRYKISGPSIHFL